MATQDSITVNGHQVSARQIIRARIMENTVGGDEISELHGQRIYWHYRTSYRPDGVIDNRGGYQCEPADADMILIDNGWDEKGRHIPPTVLYLGSQTRRELAQI